MSEKRVSAGVQGVLGGAYALWELFFPAVCASCGLGGQALLYADDAGLPRRHGLCLRCARNIRRNTARPYTPMTQHPLPAPLAAGTYRGVLTHSILAMKNAGRLDTLPELSRPLADALAVQLYRGVRNGEVAPHSTVYIIPCPSTAASIRRRGYCPAEELVRGAVRSLKKRPAVESLGLSIRNAPVLRMRPKSKAKAGQKGLGATARARRVHRTMHVSTDVSGWTCFVCDDVLTTGATAAEAIRALRHAGARVQSVSVLASVARPSEPIFRGN